MAKVGDTYYLKSGKECTLLGVYDSKYWLVAKDKSWGPGTISKFDVSKTRPEIHCPHCKKQIF